MPIGWLPLFSSVMSAIVVDRRVFEVVGMDRYSSNAGASSMASPLERIDLRMNSPSAYGRCKITWLCSSSAVCSAKLTYASKTASFSLKS